MTTNEKKSTAYWSNYSAGSVPSSARIPVVPGRSCAFKAWIKTELSAGAGHLTLAFFTRDGKWAAVPKQPPWGVASEEVTGTSDWVEKSVILTAPADADSAVLFFRVKDAVGRCWFDAMTFEEEL